MGLRLSYKRPLVCRPVTTSVLSSVHQKSVLGPSRAQRRVNTRVRFPLCKERDNIRQNGKEIRTLRVGLTFKRSGHFKNFFVGPHLGWESLNIGKPDPTRGLWLVGTPLRPRVGPTFRVEVSGVRASRRESVTEQEGRPVGLGVAGLRVKETLIGTRHNDRKTLDQQSHGRDPS